MTRISRSALLPYPASAMFALVGDIEAYPHYMQGCLGAVIHSATADEVVASLELGKAGLRYRLTTRNALNAPESISMVLVDGPFSTFHAQWQFRSLSASACKVSLELEFEFSASLLDAALGALFDATARDLVGAVCRRAEQIYGKS